ncbi:radical SAM protein [Oleispirillum naphthae]|uniref:radical SAM protein n=1 Tax=Oleispirillum naphthae TaxID=2838853 RepID=UPI00308233E9
MHEEAAAAPGLLKLLVVWVTTRCQLRCRYCYMEGGEVAAEDLDPRLFSRVAQTVGFAPGAEVQIAGGEPGLVPEVMAEVARLARGLGVARVNVQTNGLCIGDRFLDTVRRYRLGVGVSLDGPPAVNDRVRGRSGEVFAGLARLEAAGIPFGVTAVVCRGTVATLPDLALLLAGFSRARSIGLDVLRPAGRAAEADLPAAAEVAAAYAALADRLDWVNRRRSAPIRLREAALAACGARDAFCAAEEGSGAALTPGGRLYACAGLVGLAEHDCGTADAPDLARLRRGLHPPKGCAACALGGCGGRCPARAVLSPRAAALDCVMRHAAAVQAGVMDL